MQTYPRIVVDLLLNTARNTKLLILGALLLVDSILLDFSSAANVSIHSECRLPTVAEIQAAVPSGAYVRSFFIDSDADVLSVGNVILRFPGIYNSPIGSDTAPPDSAVVALFPELGADSFITTPGITSTAGGSLGDDNATWFDTSDNGPVEHFQFAQITTIGVGSWSFEVSVASATGPNVFQFYMPDPLIEFCIPEPSAMTLAGLGILVHLFCRRRETIGH